MNQEVKHIIDEVLNDYFVNESIKIYNKTLCPLLWDSNKNLDLNIRNRLLEIANDFYEKTKFVAPIQDIWLMGSISNYNWTPKSDIDVHIIIDFSAMQMPPETAEKMARVTATNWNAEHDITIKGFKVELNIQSVKAKKPYVTGVYSLLNNQWIRNPSHLDLHLDMSLIKSEYEKVDNYINSALKTNDEDFLKLVKDYLDEYRQYGLDSKGELSVENIVYKLLRNKGKIQKLKDLIISVYDKDLSIDEELPLSGEEKYCKQEPGGTMMAVNIDEFGLPDSIANKDYCWLWDKNTQSIIAKRGDSHDINFGHDNTSNTFKGWYDTSKKIISVVFPDYELRKLGGKKPDETDIPLIVYKALIRQFGERIKGFSISETTQKDIKSTHPKLHKNVANDMSLMTLDNLKALRDKCGRAMEYLGPLSDDNTNNKLWYDQAVNDYNKFNNEIKNRLKYINRPIFESDDVDYDVTEDFYRRKDEQMVDLAILLKNSHGKGKVPWRTVSASLLKKTWLIFGKYNKVNENDIDKIADQILTNIARLDASTEMMGHSSTDGRESLKDLGYEFTDEEWDSWMSDYFTDKNGAYMLSDYGLPKLHKIYPLIFNAHTPEEKLYAVDKALNVIHQRSDLAAMFVEGGSKTLRDIFNQGGYTAPENKVNEGVGAGNPNTDRLHIPGERWRIKMASTPKMPNSIKENKLELIKNRIKSLTDDNIIITVQKSEEFPESNYIQVDDVSNGVNHFSTNPENMIKLGYNMPTSDELFKLPQGRYNLADAKQKLGLNEGFDSNVKNMTHQLIDEFIKKIK